MSSVVEEGVLYPTEAEIRNAIQPKPKIAEDFLLAEVSIRISNPLATIKFYTGVLGMTLLTWWNDQKTRTTNYVFTFVDEAIIPPKERDENHFNKWRLSRAGNIEMAYSWDGITGKTKYECGALRPNEFGHFGVAVPNYKKAMERFRSLGCTIIPCKNDESLSYILDPDGYRIEIFTVRWGDDDQNDG